MGIDTFPMSQLIKVQLADFYQVSDPNSTETAKIAKLLVVQAFHQ